MRVLADENFPRPIVESLRKQHHDVLWARTDCPGLKDRTLLERAEADGRVVLTLDKDFWQIALQRPIPLTRCGVILFRLFPAIPENLNLLLIQLFAPSIPGLDTSASSPKRPLR
jgi:predicted nuclease of predicted toxin-antitoxin system